MGRLNGINSFFVYYGEAGISKLKGFDLVIVEPKGQCKESIQALKEAGCKVLGYISVTEAALWQIEEYGLIEDDFVKVEGKTAMNAEYGNVIVSLQAIRWREALDEDINYVMTQMGMDGLFFDTVSNLEREGLTPAQANGEMSALVHYMGLIRQRYPEALFVQNNGIVSVLPETAPFLDGLLLENSPIIICSDGYHCQLEKRLMGLSKVNGIQVLNIVSRSFMGVHGIEEIHIEKWCTERGFIYRISDEYYQQLDE